MIEVKNLCKSFEDFAALKDLNLHVDKGSIYGLVGVNGSGKTTLIKHLTGVLVPDSGSVIIDGQPVQDNIELKERVGYISDDLYFFGNYDLKSMSKFYAKLYPNWDQARYKHMVEKFELPENKRISKFSKGMQKQAAFVLTMSAKPDCLILDEPVDGLDPVVRKRVWKYVVNDVAEREMTVLVSSHNLRELEGLVDHVGIMYQGSIKLERGNLDELESEGGLLSLEELFFKEMGGDDDEI